jgi:RNA polymerase sigma factor (sigma-70 family)
VQLDARFFEEPREPATPADDETLDLLRADFRAYCEENAGRLLRIARRYSLNGWDAEDAHQGVLEKFWKKWGDDEFRKRIWMSPGLSATAVVNVCRDTLRSERSRTDRQDRMARQAVDSEDDYSRVDARDTLDWMLAFLERLDPTWRLIIQLRYMEEKSFEEAAAALGVSEATARRFEKRARKALEDAYQRN